MSDAARPPRHGPRFVVRGGAGAALPKALDEQADVQPLASASGGWRVQWHQANAKPESVRKALHKLLGAGFEVFALINSEDGAERYPTGQLIVRWPAPASDTEVQALAQQHHLRLVQRTRFTHNQAVYRAAPGTDLAALLSQLVHSPGVEKAWLEAESAYQRNP